MDAARRHGGDRDFLNGKIFPTMFWFSLPVVASTLFQQLYSTVDTAIVGNVLGENALAAIGAASSVYDLLVGLALGLGNGLSIVIAHCYGSRDVKRMKRSVATSFAIGLSVSVLLTIVGMLALRPALKLLNTPEEILEEAYQYISLIVLFVTAFFLYNLFAGILRAIGDSMMPFVFLVFSSVLNIGLDYAFILWFGMGVAGAALATVISQSAAAVLSFVYLVRRKPEMMPGRGDWVPEKALYLEMAAQGCSMSFMQGLISAGSVILQTGINSMGTLVIAGHTAARRIMMFGLMPYSGMISAVTTFVSQNYGAGKVDRIRKSVKIAYLYSFCTTIVVMAVFIGFGRPLVRLISGSDNSVVLDNGAMYLRVAAPFLMVLGLINDSRSALQAIGEKVLPVLSSVIEVIGKILFTALLIPLWGYTAVAWCEPVIWCFMAAELVPAFWLNKKIRGRERAAADRGTD